MKTLQSNIKLIKDSEALFEALVKMMGSLALADKPDN